MPQIGSLFQTPQNKEEYFYRSIFESHFPSQASAETVPSVPSVACSTPIALEWDKSLKILMIHQEDRY